MAAHVSLPLASIEDGSRLEPDTDLKKCSGGRAPFVHPRFDHQRLSLECVH